MPGGGWVCYASQLAEHHFDTSPMIGEEVDGCKREDAKMEILLFGVEWKA